MENIKSKPSPQVENALIVLGVRFQDFKNAVDGVILAQAQEIDRLKTQLEEKQKAAAAQAAV